MHELLISQSINSGTGVGEVILTFVLISTLTVFPCVLISSVIVFMSLLGVGAMLPERLTLPTGDRETEVDTTEGDTGMGEEVVLIERERLFVTLFSGLAFELAVGLAVALVVEDDKGERDAELEVASEGLGD